ncbi:hypothetical protein AVEN_46842-1 [Araneus ventricosus]|uniref:Uncharacterized protein n=1 Tax=Araneus ventricosus TaxID=182803 RepID=A0A4Y2CLK7_ARAVE|nr:hypothetical protein AVEN_46842-1 [Araneus ventricosus]
MIILYILRSPRSLAVTFFPTPWVTGQSRCLSGKSSLTRRQREPGVQSGASGLLFSGRDEKGATPSCDEKSTSDPPAIPRNPCRTCLHPKSLRQLARGTLFGPTCNPKAETASAWPAPIGARERHLCQHPVKFEIGSEVLKLGVNQQSSKTGGSGGQLPNSSECYNGKK